jgi:hypothetical protein
VKQEELDFSVLSLATFFQSLVVLIPAILLKATFAIFECSAEYSFYAILLQKEF